MKTRIKKICASLLAAAMVFTYMPAMTFTAFADDDAAKYEVTLAHGDKIEKSSLAAAIAAVDEGGTIVATGLVNESAVINEDIDFTLDFSGATFAAGKSLTADKQNKRCLVEKDGIYSYHKKHDVDHAEAVQNVDDETEADVTIYCKHGDSDLYEAWPYDTKEVTSNTDEEITTVYTIEVVPGITASWTVVTKKTEAPDVYDLIDDSVDYVKERKTGLAVKDADGKVQFIANYKKNDVPIVDADTGKLVELKGAIKSSKKLTQAEAEAIGGGVFADQNATKDQYGTSSYEVTFTFPDETKDSVWVYNVVDADMTVPAATTKVVGIEFLKSVSATGVVSWKKFDDEGETAVEVYKPDGLVLGEDGSLTYHLLYEANEEGVAPISGENKTLAPKTSDVKKCGAAAYSYDMIKETYEKDSNIHTYKFVPKVTVDGTHAYGNYREWAENFTVNDPHATHSTPGSAVADCKECGEKNIDVVIPKTSDHQFKKDASGKEIVKTIDATCTHYGFQYKICEKNDGGWKGGKYVLALDNEGRTYEFSATDPDFANGAHPVLVEGTVKEKLPHKYYVVNEQVKWNTENEDKVTATLRQRCELEGEGADVYWYVYHQESFADYKAANGNVTLLPGSADTALISTEVEGVVAPVDAYHVFGAITQSISTAAKDCSEYDKYIYTVKGVSKADGSAIVSDEVTSKKNKGSHSYKNTVTFSNDGKFATVTQQCTVKGCTGPQVKKVDADVTSEDNADGSTTYTASLEGEVLGTKTVFDLTKAVVTVNGGEPLDLNTVGYDEEAAREAARAASAAVTAARTELRAEANDYADDEADKESAKYHYSEPTITGTGNNRYARVNVTYGDDTTVIHTASVRAQNPRDDERNKQQATRQAQTWVTNNRITPYRTEVFNNKLEELQDALYAEVYEETYAELAGTGLKDSVVVTINGAVVDSKLYNVTFTGPVAGELVKGVNTISVTGDPDGNAVGTATGTVTCIIPGTLTADEVKLDGQTANIYEEFTYDGKSHTVTATVKTGAVEYETVPDAEVKYAVTDGSEPKTFGETAEIKDAGQYVVWAQFSKEGYTTEVEAILFVEVSKKTFADTVISTDVQHMVYGDTNFSASTGDAAIDEEIGLTTVDASKHGVGTFALEKLVSYDKKNYSVDVDKVNVVIEKRNATIVMKDTTVEHDGNPVDLSTLYKIDGAVNGDTLNVIVSVEGGVTPQDVGTYTLIATANDANYNVKEVSATLTIVESEAEKKEAAMAEAQLVKNAAAQIDDTYPADAKANVQAKVAALDEVLANPEATSTDVEAAVKNLSDAIGAAYEAKAEAEDDAAKKEAAAKKAALDAAVDAVAKATKVTTANGYPSAAVNDVVAAQKAVEGIMSLADSTSADIQAKVEALNAAIKLADAKKSAQKITEKNGYTAASASAVAKAVKTNDADKINDAVKAAKKKAKNTMTVKAKTVKVKATKKTKIKKSKAFKVKKAKGKVTFKKVSGNKKITVSKKGKVTVKKGLKAGKTYKVKVKVKAAGNGNYLSKTKTVTLKVKVKANK